MSTDNATNTGTANVAASRDHRWPGGPRGYSAHLVLDLTFHSWDDLDEYYRGLGHDPNDSAWTIVADLIEYADATLNGLHLTGNGSGILLDGYPNRVRALARHADGTIDALGEDNTAWQHRLSDGLATTRAGQVEAPDSLPHPRGTSHGTRLDPLQNQSLPVRAASRDRAMGRH